MAIVFVREHVISQPFLKKAYLPKETFLVYYDIECKHYKTGEVQQFRFYIPDGLYVKECKYGWGLFTNKKFYRGDEIGRYLTFNTKKLSDYSIRDPKEGLQDLICPFRYINHSDKPNVGYFADNWVRALHVVEKDQQLFAYYKDHLKIRLRAKSKNN